MLDTANTTQATPNFSADALLGSDYELNGTINRAASEGAKFALILAMLEQDCTYRPHIDKPKDTKAIPEAFKELNYCRSSPLSVDDTYWRSSQQTSQLIQQGQVHSARLWLAMHPEPLSQFNNPDEIDEEVIANCSINAQARFNQAKQKVVKVDETGLYDILQELNPNVAEVA